MPSQAFSLGCWSCGPSALKSPPTSVATTTTDSLKPALNDLSPLGIDKHREPMLSSRQPAMTLIQKFLMSVLPKRLAEEMRAESRQWQIRCSTCGNTRSIWDVGGIRWKATSTGKSTVVRCSHCGDLRKATIDRIAG